jgi:hypothetical protein
MPLRQLTISDGLARLPGPQGERFVELFRHGTLSIELYAPRQYDPQSPHTRDEAGVEHRFEEFTDDLLVWVFFYGPEGGESEVGRRESGVKQSRVKQSRVKQSRVKQSRVKQSRVKQSRV